ncbi:hypothetical protein U9M48_002437 [Paspalum notatum var. saurae]|uniref:KIB1-4 beta-propeller domain-containing protein n=1 Tax=Paspalum notatum var. saurae TaxID=547442 RepID=A0AAQ3PJT4_PASNO
MGAGGGPVAAVVDAATEETASYPAWSQLPWDPLFVVMAALEIRDLVRSEAVCSSWRAAYAEARRLRIIPTTAVSSAPSLLYARADDDPDTCTVLCPGVLSSSFRDEAFNLFLVNPLTGAQHALPPVTALHHTEAAGDIVREADWWNYDLEHLSYTARELRVYMYFKAVLSCAPSCGDDCVVLLLHMPNGQLSFARPGDELWTWIRSGDDDDDDDGDWWSDHGYRDAAYSDKDGVFYVLSYTAAVITVDLKGPSPVVKRVMKGVTSVDDPTKYLAMAPWGDLLQVSRITESRSSLSRSSTSRSQLQGQLIQ